jgi:hypothetical protein
MKVSSSCTDYQNSLRVMFPWSFRWLARRTGSPNTADLIMGLATKCSLYSLDNVTSDLFRMMWSGLWNLAYKRYMKGGLPPLRYDHLYQLKEGGKKDAIMFIKGNPIMCELNIRQLNEF